jgi:hypothetical protein
MSLTIEDYERHKAEVNMKDYPHRVEHIFQAFHDCEKQNVPVGNRLDRIDTLYNHDYGKDHFDCNTSCPVTDEAEVLALILDYANIDKEHMIEHSPLLTAHYETFKRAGLNVDTKPLYEYLKDELSVHLERYGLIKKLSDADMQAYEKVLEKDAEEIEQQNSFAASKTPQRNLDCIVAEKA